MLMPTFLAAICLLGFRCFEVCLRAHPTVLDVTAGFMGLCLVPPCLVSEYCTRGSMYDLLHEAARSPALAAKLTWHRRLRMVSWDPAGRQASAPRLQCLHSFQAGSEGYFFRCLRRAFRMTCSSQPLNCVNHRRWMLLPEWPSSIPGVNTMQPPPITIQALPITTKYKRPT